MKAIVYEKYGSPDVLKLKEIERPTPKNNEVLIKIFATTVTAVDSIFRQGNQFFARLATGITKPKNQILGAEFSGEIESVGKDVKLFKPGDYVFGAHEGTQCEYICLPEDGVVVRKPSNINFNEAAAVAYGTLTALPFLRDNGKIRSGQKVLIIGASGAVGTYAVQFGKYFGAEVTGVCSTSNLEMVKSIGADKIVDYTKEHFTTNGEKYDIIFDTVGKSSFAECKKSLTKNGIYLTAAISMTILLQMLWTSKIGAKKAQIAFTGLRSTGDKAKDLALIKVMIANEKIKPIIDKTFPLEQINQAYSYVDKGHKKGNVTLTLNGN